MKKQICILLAFCAFAAVQSSPVPGLSDYFNSSAVQQKIDDFIEKAKEAYQNASDQVSKYVKDITTQLNDLINDGKNKLKSVYDEIEKKLTELKKSNEKDNACADKYDSEFNKILDNGKANLEKCYQNAVQEGKNAQEKVANNIENMKKDNEKLIEQIKECMSTNLVSVAKCIYDKWDVFNSALEKLASEAKNVYNESVSVGTKIVKETNECFKVTYNKANEDIQEFNKKVDECVAESA